MGKTSYTIQENDFLINGKKTYTELEKSNPKVHGLLFNARFIQGVFNDKTRSIKRNITALASSFLPTRTRRS